MRDDQFAHLTNQQLDRIDEICEAVESAERVNSGQLHKLLQDVDATLKKQLIRELLIVRLEEKLSQDINSPQTDWCDDRLPHVVDEVLRALKDFDVIPPGKECE